MTGPCRAAWASLLLAVAPLQGAREIPLSDLDFQASPTSRAARRTAEGLVLPVDGLGVIVPRLQGVEVLELDYRATGILLLTWTTTRPDMAPQAHLSPWHHKRLEIGTGRLTLEMRTTPEWTPDRIPILFLEGAGELVVTGIRGRSIPADQKAVVQGWEEANRWAPIWIDHATINQLLPVALEASRGRVLSEALGLAFLAFSIGGALTWLAWRKRWRPAPFLAVVGVVAAMAGNIVFAARIWPSLALRPQPDASARLRENLHFRPELGALAGMARNEIRAGERVGVQVAPGDWFGWETLCFHLAPRPCVLVDPGAGMNEGLSGVHRLRAEELDAVVYHHATAPLLPGFTSVVSVGPESYVARRR